MIQNNQPTADRVVQNIEIISKTFNLVPGVQESHRLYHQHNLLCGTNRKSHGQNSGSLKKL